ncbi:MAG: aminotransferase class I/II-fold pyridoxal phosphate-dependent enzyme, partial [Cetobacterium sp.]|uniref:aminotransferase class I/II-fold pyridoxal phosphate-dependent enzyme n=1 Tax=Cetobacterium sp. TaxID=2071632 RepID=UPI002FC7F0EB
MKFDEIINRRGTYSTQWDYIEDRFGEGTKDLTPFSISDTDFKSPQPILDAILERTQHGIFGYSRWNHDEYKNSIKKWYKNRYKTNIEKDWIVYSPTVIYSISVLLERLVGLSGKVMTHTPRYDGFSKILKPYNLYEVQLKEDKDGVYRTDFIQIEKGFRDGVKVFLLCNPENPTGKVWSLAELEKLISLCKKYDVILLSDDIHMDIARKD